MTSKQVAERLKESPGNIHYHMQKLYKADLLELVETRESSGILEKYYRSVADRFDITDLKDPTVIPTGQARSRMFSFFNLTEQELQMFMDELLELLTKWENRISLAGASEVVFDASIVVPDSLKLIFDSPLGGVRDCGVDFALQHKLPRRIGGHWRESTWRFLTLG